MQYTLTNDCRRDDYAAMALKPRYVFPLNFRSEDLELLNAAVQIAKDETSDLTTVMREALRLYTKSKLKSGNIKMDEFLDQVDVDPIFRKVLAPTELKGWVDSDLLRVANLVRGRKQEIESELKRRGFHYVW